MKDLGRKIDNKSTIDTRVSEIIKNVPTFDSGFFTFAELQANSRRLKVDYRPLFESGFAKSEIVGHSTEGRPIELLKIGNGRKKALWFGTPHPNEPTGTLTTDYLAEQLCANPEIAEMLDATFLIIKSADPDGMVLNEGWFKGKLTPLNYALNFYRPAGYEQVEWSFPITYEPGLSFDKPSLETQAIMKVIEEYKPDFMYSLHNAASGATWFTLSREIPEFYLHLKNITENNNLSLSGRSESPWAEKLIPGIYKLPTARDRYEYLKRLGQKPEPDSLEGGESTGFLLENSTNPSLLSLRCEIPIFSNDVSSDTSLTNRSLREFILEGIDRSKKTLNFMIHHLNKLRDQNKLPDSRLSRSAIWYPDAVLTEHRAERQRHVDSDDPNYNRLATKAEKFDALHRRQFFNATSLGEVYRLAIEAGEIGQAEEIKQEVKKIFDEIQEYGPIKAVPLKDLVRTQLESGLKAMQYVEPEK